MYVVYSPNEWVGIVTDAEEAMFWRAFGYTVQPI